MRRATVQRAAATNARRQWLTLRHDRGPLQRVVQLSHVPGPVVFEQGAPCAVGQCRNGPSERPPDVIEKRVAQQGDVASPLPNRRERDIEQLAPVVQVVAERAAFDGVRQIAFGGGNHPDVVL